MAAQVLHVQVVYALPERCFTIALELAPGACVADALAKADLARAIPGVEVDPSRLAVFGRTASPDTALHDGDRVEVLRPLVADPKQARRRRARDAAKR